MKRRLWLLVIIVLASANPGKSQTVSQAPLARSADFEESQLISELQMLIVQSDGRTSPLARARGKAEIASALWYLDEDAAKRILTKAYELTFPEKAEQEKSRAKSIGSDMEFANEAERARTEVRGRILQVAGRDRTFVSQLIKMGSSALGLHESHLSNALLARQAITDGDTKKAGEYISEAIDAEPTHTAAGLLIREIATRDRAAADALIIKYLDRLRGIPFSFSQSTQRIYLVLFDLVFPATLGLNRQVEVQPPGPQVMRAYASYVVQSLGQLAQRDANSLIRLRRILLTAGQAVRQYAPELMSAYLQLEELSRGGRAGNPIQTPEEITESLRQAQQQNLDKALDREPIDASLIEVAVRRGLFGKARRAAQELPEGDRKTQVMDLIDATEATRFRSKGEIAQAEKLTERLRTAHRIFEAYAALIYRCGENKFCKVPLIDKALKQITAAQSLPPVTPLNVPAGLGLGQRELDTKLSSLSQLAIIAIKTDTAMGRTLLVAVLAAINGTTVDSDLGRLGFDVEVFRLWAQNDPTDAKTLAGEVADPLRQIAALSAVDEVKAKELKKKEPKEPVSKKRNM